MDFWIRRAAKSILLPNGVILLLSVVLLIGGWIPISQSAVNFFYYAVFIAAALLAWRFHSTRVMFCLIVLLMGHHAMEFLAHGKGTATGAGRIAFEAVALLIPLDFV